MSHNRNISIAYGKGASKKGPLRRKGYFRLHSHLATTMHLRPECPTRLVMVPFDVRESMSISVAARFSGKSENTIRLWAERYGIGRKIVGDWHRIISA